MLGVRATDVEPTSIEEQRRRARRTWNRFYLSALAATAFLALAVGSTGSGPFAIAFAVLALVAVGTAIRPSVGLYAIVFFTMAGDSAVMPWYPMVKNFSSPESILFIADPLTFSPLEALVAWTACCWLLDHRLGGFKTPITWGRMFWPLAVFTGFVVVGFMNGLRQQGDLRIAIFEGRALFLLLPLYLLIINICVRREQYVRLFVLAMIGVFIQSAIAIQYWLGLDSERQEFLEQLTQHSASLHIGVLLLFILGLCLFPKCRPSMRWTMIAFAGPSVVSFVLSQRRSGFNALGLGLILFLAVLYVERRRAFWWFTPIMVVLAIGYVLAFWNVTGGLGFGAQAVKSLIAPDELDARDRSSNLYREIEANNVWFTIRQRPELGVGFGRRFLQPWTLPDLGPGFEFKDYIPHNSLLWMWMKMGYFGFVATMVVITRSIQLGARSVTRMPAGDERAMITASLASIVMYVVFTFVDIGWDARSLVFLTLAVAWCSEAADTATTPSRTQRRVSSDRGLVDERPILQPIGT